MNYKEEFKEANQFKQDYLDSIEKWIKQRQSECDELRQSNAKEIISNPEKARSEFIKMLGYPLTEKERMPLSVERNLLASENGINIYRMKIEVFENFYFYGLFFEYEGERLPLVISQHGGQGTPELCSGLNEGGSSNYNDMTERILKHRVHVFAPQLLLWNKEGYEIDFDRKIIDAKLKQLGGSITALEIYCIKCSISYFESLDCVDSEHIGMIGLSYGGFYTLFTTAADTRIKAALACSQFNNRNEYSWIDWAWNNAAKSFMDSEIALLCYPRKLCVAVGSDDELFDAKLADEEYNRLLDEAEQCGIDNSWIDFEIFNGTHEFCKDDRMIDIVISELKK